MELARRDFLKELGALAAIGAFGGTGRVFAAPKGWVRPDNARLVFGLVSDTHLRGDMTGEKLSSPSHYLRAAFKYFKEQGADAIVHCGDMADRGHIRELEFHAEIWRDVFGGVNRGPVKLFVAGNHDLEGFRYGLGRPHRSDNIFPDPEELTKHLLAEDFATHWERIWGEKYERVWHKTVKGYHFFGRHWDVEESELATVLGEWQGATKGAQPFFLLSHERSMELGDSPLDLRNAIGFFGHWHCSASNWNQIHFFPGYSFPNIQVPSMSSYGGMGFGKDAYISSAPLEGAEAVPKGYQGLVVRIYDDFLAIERREFSEGGSLGPDWIMPLDRGTANHPFSKDELKKVIGVPQFRKGAKLEVASENSATPRLTPAGASASRTASGWGIRVRIPLADGNPDSRVYAYEVEIGGARPQDTILRAVYAKGANMGIGHEPDGGVTTLTIPMTELPPTRRPLFTVRPLSSLGTRGESISSRYAI